MTDERFKFFEGTPRRLASGEVLYTSHVTGKVSIVDRDTYLAASRCADFQTVQAHADILTGSLSGRAALRRDAGSLLAGAVQTGLLLSETYIRERLSGGFEPAERRTIHTVAIPTRDRPQMLARALRSLGEHLGKHGRSPEVVVVDDSDSAATQRANKTSLAHFQESTGLDCRYAHHASIEQFAKALSAEADCPSEITDFALRDHVRASISVGCGRNAVLLGTVGKCLLFMDDDVQCITARVHDAGGEIAFRAEQFGSWFLQSEAEIERCEVTNESLLDLHESVLNIDGAPTAEAGSYWTRANLSDTSPSCLARLETGQARVKVSQMGLLGDAATNDPLAYFLQGNGTVARLTETQDRYDAAMSNRLVLCGPRRPFVSEYLACMTYCTAIDNTDLLPPFLPVERGEEFVFGVLLNRCIPGALFGAMPRAVVHRPPEARSFTDPSPLSRAGRLTAAETIAALIGSARLQGSSSIGLLKAMASHLKSFSDMDDAVFARQLRSCVAQTVMTQLATVDALLPECPRTEVDAAQKLTALRNAYIDAMNTWDYSVPLDFRGARPIEEERIRFRTLIQNFAEVLHWWPRIVSAATALNRKGQSPFVAGRL